MTLDQKYPSAFVPTLDFGRIPNLATVAGKDFRSDPTPGRYT